MFNYNEIKRKSLFSPLSPTHTLLSTMTLQSNILAMFNLSALLCSLISFTSTIYALYMSFTFLLLTLCFQTVLKNCDRLLVVYYLCSYLCYNTLYYPLFLWHTPLCHYWFLHYILIWHNILPLTSFLLYLLNVTISLSCLYY